jgi:hypothetical protein
VASDGAPGTTRFSRPDYYKVLQVDESAHPDVVRAAYRTLLRTLGKHPDLGGSGDEAQTIIEAYRTLSDPARRSAYDRWLRAHSARPARKLPAPPPPPPPPAPRVVDWVRALLPEYRLAPKAPFARSFDLVLEGPGMLTPRLYLKTFPAITRAQWPTIFILCRAVGVARPGLVPSTDLVLLVARTVQELEAFVAEAERHSGQWAWNRWLIGLATLVPPALHTGSVVIVPSALRRLRGALLALPPDEVARLRES